MREEPIGGLVFSGMIDDVTMHSAGPDDLDLVTLYRLLQLRARIFVVEQGDPYLDLDGRDLEPGTCHLWLARDGEPVAYLRLLAEPGPATRIGRVVVAKDARNRGLARLLMEEALRRIGARRCVLNAQAHLTGFYAQYGFEVSGEEYVQGNIPHVPMTRPARQPE